MIEKYELMNEQVSILDGENFKIQVKGWNRANQFEYPNPDEYLKHYPEIDELNFICEILDLVQTEFHLWKK